MYQDIEASYTPWLDWLDWLESCEVELVEEGSTLRATEHRLDSF